MMVVDDGADNDIYFCRLLLTLLFDSLVPFLLVRSK